MAQAHTERKSLTIALIGNPNAGKTTLFNALTGSHQRVGNYPGVTVEKISGRFKVGDEVAECIDAPGLYSLNAVSEDEQVAVDLLLNRTQDQLDGVVCVVDSTNLERNLYLFSQLAGLKLGVIVALTMTDRLKDQGKSLDTASLEAILGVPVVAVSGHNGSGVDSLKRAILEIGKNGAFPEPDLALPLALQVEAEALQLRLARSGLDLPYAHVIDELLRSGSQLAGYLETKSELGQAFVEARAKLTEVGISSSADLKARYVWAEAVTRQVIQQTGPSNTHRADRLDRILTHRVWGLAVFVSLMYLVFQSIYTFAQPLMDFIQGGFDHLSRLISPHLAGSPAVQSLICDGIISGVGSMLVFLPQILILFFFIAVLEGSGYLARAAFLMDKLLGWCGLNGRAFIPLLASFACAIPGIMAARVMPDKRSRLTTILVAPLMSCSARLPVYLLLIGAFIEPKYGAFWAGFSLFAMHFLGLIVSIPIARLLNGRILKGKRLPFVLELPPYQWPKPRDVMLTMYFRGKVFVQVAGTTIVTMSIIIWALSYFPRSASQDVAYRTNYRHLHASASPQQVELFVEQQRLANSYLGDLGRSIEPAFRPAGFDWRMTTAILSAFPARETVVPALGIIFNVGKDVDTHPTDLRQSLSQATWPDGRPLLTPWTAVGLMVFFALCCQCTSTLATVRRETNSWKWPALMFTYMTLMAYIGAVLINQIGHLFGA